ncbi:MAG: hypothetical protein E6772_07720 [Dysgonomonas sp.]|nr:hypothetical protein [Dysgonomonas sp.]
MKITTTDLTARIESGDSTFTHPINTISYVITKQFDGVTLFKGNHEIGSSTFSQTVVNGKILTAENADSLLSSLFTCCNGGGSSDRVQTDYLEEDTANPAYLKNRPISKIQEGEELPQTTIPGHVCMVYDAENKLKFVYEWDGFVWIKTGADYNLIFDDTFGVSETYERFGTYAKKFGITYYYYVDPDSIHHDEYATIRTSNIHKLTDEYKLSTILFLAQKHYGTILLDNFDTRHFSISRHGYMDRDASVENLILKDGKCGSVNVSRLNTKQIRIENLQPHIEAGGEYATIHTAINLEGYDMSVINNKACDNIHIRTPHGEEYIKETCKIHIEGNTSAEKEAGISITNENNVDLDYDISVIDNLDFKYFGISGCKTINNLNINLQPTLLEVTSYSCSFSAKALQNLVDALTSTEFTNMVKFFYSRSQPALTQTQLEALAANNINVQVL